MSQYNFIASDRELKPLSYGIRNEGGRFFIDKSNYLQISKQELFEDLTLYTDARFITGIGFGRKFLERPEKLLDYLRSALEAQTSIEVFSIWLDEKNEVEKKSCHIDELDGEILKWVFSYGSFKNPRHLKIYKYSRGKK